MNPPVAVPMPTRSRSLACLIGLAVFSAAGAPGAELLINPGFESGTMGWVGRNCAIEAVSSPVRGGAGAVRVFNRTKNWQSVRQDILPVVLAHGAGEYTVQASIRAESGAGTAKIKLILIDDAGTTVLNSPATANDTGWTTISDVRTLSWVGTLAEAYFEVPHDTETASYFVDDCSLKPVTAGRAPAFYGDPVVEVVATQGVAYAATLADEAFDPEGDPLTFTKIAGPDWLTVAADGALSGTPAVAGLNAFTVQVTDGTDSSDPTALQVTVLPPVAETVLPYAESFETGDPWAPAWLAQGWAAAEAEAPLVIPHVPGDPHPDFPFALPHRQVLDIRGRAVRALDGSVPHAEIRIDTLLQPVFRTDPLLPALHPGAHTGFYFNRDGRLVVHHQVYADDFTTASPAWSILDHPPAAEGQWVRLTVVLDAHSDTLRGHWFFSVSLDGQRLTGPAAYTSPSPTSEATDGNGPWFLCATSGPETSPTAFSGLAVDGAGRLDDLAVSDPLRVTTRGTPWAWIESYYPGGDAEVLDGSDTDGDGRAAWEEYQAGTDPTQGGSLLRGALRMAAAGTAEITWPSSLQGALTPYHVHRSIDLPASGGGWEPVAGPLPRDLGGIGRWTDASPPAAAQAYYRVSIPVSP